MISLESFYTSTGKNGISFNITPDLGFNEHSTKLITKNQQLYSDFKKSLDEVDGLGDANLKKAFRAKIEEYIGKKLKESAPNDLKLKEIKVSEDVIKFPNTKLNELSDDCKRFNIGRYLQYL